MHLSIGHRRQGSKARDLHIRKVSFSGCSLASGCSFESTSTTSTTRPPWHARSDSSGSYDPLRSHPIVHPPPRLQDRAMLRPSSGDSAQMATFFNDTESEDEYTGYPMSVFEYDTDEESVFDRDDDLPPLASPSDHSDVDDDEPSDYFFMEFARRPAFPRSRWSDSTIQTINQLTPAISSANTPDVIEHAIAVPLPRLQQLPNFSYKRNTVPKRPTIQASDSVEDLVKRGGWKRRGIVFHNEDVDSEPTQTGIAA